MGQDDKRRQDPAVVGATAPGGAQDPAGPGSDSQGIVGTEDEDPGAYLQDGGSPQAGFAEQGRGAANDAGDIEQATGRTQEQETDIEGSSL